MSEVSTRPPLKRRVTLLMGALVIVNIAVVAIFTSSLNPDLGALGFVKDL
jgi:hypothetical protein